MSGPMEMFLKRLMAETNADNVTIEEDNASAEMPVPNLLFLHSSSSSDVSISFSSFQNSSSTSLDSFTGSRSSRWDSIPSIDGDRNKEKRERIPSIPRRSLEEKDKWIVDKETAGD